MTPFTVIDCAQRSAEWFAARVGRLTGSVADKAIYFKKSGEESEDRKKLRRRLVCELLTGRSQDEDEFVTNEIQRGIDLEPSAVAAYEAVTGAMVRTSGFLSHNSLMAGCSLDGHVGANYAGIVEIKCPKSATHLAYLQGGCLPEDYEAQATHNLWVSGADWLDFVSYDDRFLNERLHLFCVRVTRQQLGVEAYEAKARRFLDEMDRDYRAVLSTYDPVAQLDKAVASC